YPINSRRADVAVILAEGKKPLLIIETKRKYEKRGYYRAIRKIMPTSRVVIEQALWYAVYSGAPYFATTNGRVFALFRRPETGEKFSFSTHRIVVKERIVVNEEFAEELLITVAKLYRQVPVAVTPLDWSFIIVLRDFVNWLSEVVEPLIRKKLKTDEAFKAEYEKFAEEVGYKPDAAQLAKEMSYVFMNKIVFYKVLERHFKELGKRKLKSITAPDAKAYLDMLYRYFGKAVEVTGDFEPVFYTGIYDEIELPDDPFVLEGINAFIEDMEHHRLEDLGSDIVGFIYEELIPAAERHALGQFYTPPAIAELITKWAVRNPDDKVLDPGCGSGTFLVKAYKRLLELKGYKEPTERAHKEILRQLYAFDINPFPLHLTALNLASRYIRAPSTEVNTIHSDFFRMSPVQKFATPYIVKTPAGEIKREIPIPKFDAIIANPPYTRWVEISNKTREAILSVIDNELKKYRLTGGISNEIGIYVHFIIYAYEFLKENGRLGMIVSNSWLQSDYGINFVNFLLDHFKVKAVIDFNQRLFRIPLIATCILLLEKEKNAKERSYNKTIFMYVDKEAKVEEILDAIKNPQSWKNVFLINVAKQNKLPRNDKWIKQVFKTQEMEQRIRNSQYTKELKAFFEARYGNITGVFARGGTGGNVFFYLTDDDVKKWELQNFVYPLVCSARYSRFFSITKKDWKNLQKEGKVCYVFIAHNYRDKLPQNVKKYIKYGEREITTRAGKTCNKSMSSLMREKLETFYGWYDLGEIINVPMFATRYAQYVHRFTLVKFSTAIDEDFIAFIPKVSLKEQEIKALLAYFNSSITRFLIEVQGRTTGGGMSTLEPNFAVTLPVLNVKKLDKKEVEQLASLFEKLEVKARKVGGADTKENLEMLQPIVNKIDTYIAKIMGLQEEFVKNLQAVIRILAERRISRTMHARPEAIKGEEEPRLKPPKKPEKPKEKIIPLDNFLNTQ
ncbi:MAG: N-6 DNA methylase, partial [Candidatus Baldrarchaeia archaeon]